MEESNTFEYESFSEEFACPISGGIMNDPVLTQAGNCYDRKSMKDGLRQK